MRITRVYTRTGDGGQTGLVGGERVDKDHARISAYGTVDELNSVLGLVRVFNRSSGAPEAAVARIDACLDVVQNELFDVGADLATPATSRWEGMHRVGGDEVDRLERWCDAFNEDLGALREFILPGGGAVGAFLHQARTVCRRAEREVVALMREDETVGDGCMRYLNRLSDFLFVLGRWAAQAAGEPEVYWRKPPR
jgi:cob(I)alamin adenosyltransferase